MTTETKDKIRLIDIKEAIERIEFYLNEVTKHRHFDEYTLQCTIVWQFEIIGEAANHLSATLRNSHKDVPWRAMIGMRNRMIHDYSEIDLNRVWETVRNDIPALKAHIDNILKEFQ